MKATERDWEAARSLVPHEPFCDLRMSRDKHCQCRNRLATIHAIADALADERERARAPFLALADREDELGSHLVTTDEVRAAAEESQ